MSSLSEKLTVLLLSIVKGNPSNKPNLYKTEVAKPLDLRCFFNKYFVFTQWEKLGQALPKFSIKTTN